MIKLNSTFDDTIQ